MPKKPTGGDLGIPVSDGYTISIDPGDEHVGVAWWVKFQVGWACIRVQEMTPDRYRRYIQLVLASGRVERLIVESFSLYGDKALQQTGYTMETSQLIGYTQALADLARVPMTRQQPAMKDPAFKIAARKGYTLQAVRQGVPGQHVKDAEIHGYRYCAATLDEPVVEAEAWSADPGDWTRDYVAQMTLYMPLAPEEDPNA